MHRTRAGAAPLLHWAAQRRCSAVAGAGPGAAEGPAREGEREGGSIYINGAADAPF